VGGGAAVFKRSQFLHEALAVLPGDESKFRMPRTQTKDEEGFGNWKQERSLLPGEDYIISASKGGGSGDLIRATGEAEEKNRSWSGPAAGITGLGLTNE